MAGCARSELTRPYLGVDAVALLVLLAAPTGARVVASDARLGAADGGTFELHAIDEVPLVTILFEGGALAVVDLHLLQLVAGDELDGPFGVGGGAAFGAQDLQAQPFRVLGPRFGVRAIDLTRGLRIVRGDDEVDIPRCVRGVARAHQLFGGLGPAFAAQDWTTAHLD